MTPADAILVAFVAFLPYADRWVGKHYADRTASRKHAAALEAKAGAE